MTPAASLVHRSTRRRRGVTLVEMLVTVAVLLILMTIIVQIFQAATGSLSGAQVAQELDNRLRHLDTTIRTDLRGVTARMTPPLDPKDNLGYFEYIENAFADQQGEDTDDCLRFTAKAPDGKPFLGRVWPGYDTNGDGVFDLPHPNGPITITSQFAEIVYFLRNGNLYRRVFLIAPERQSSIVQMIGNTAFFNNGNGSFVYRIGGTPVSWLGVNDLSARPAVAGPMARSQPSSIILNTLGDLTNRENRAFSPRFGNDYQLPNPALVPIPGNDNLPDDFHLSGGGLWGPDGIPDYYPTLYPGVLAPVNNAPLIYELRYNLNGGWAANRARRNTNRVNVETMPFPFIFPGAYSKPELADPALLGWIHSPTSEPSVPFTASGADALAYLRRLNHAPLDQGDNLPRPSPDAYQTWWGFPTWRETLSAFWTDPTLQVNDYAVNPQGQPNGLHPRPANALRADGRVVNADARYGRDLLPPMTLTAVDRFGNVGQVRTSEQLFSDGFGENGANSSWFWQAGPASLWNTSWEDDLLATGVRSFDVKAYDPALGQYQDLGWGDDLRVSGPLLGVTDPPFLYGNFDFLTRGNNAPAYLLLPATGTFFDLLNQSMAHEGRIPPRVADNRLDAQFPNSSYRNPGSFFPQYAAFPLYSSNIGDDSPAVIRLRRVWDTWSTDYTRVPANGVDSTTGFPTGPPFTPPVYPSYPPPYPAPLRGIQIQIRVVDPTNSYIKVLTIRQDFSDKL